MAINSVQSVRFTSLPQKTEAEIGDKQEKKTLSTTTKVVCGLSALALAGTAIYFGMRGKKFKISAKQEAKLQELIKNGQLDEDYLKIFKETEHLNGEKFIRTAYAKLAEKVGLTKTPELIVKPQMSSCYSSFDSITICTGGLKNKAEQFSFIRHELEHAKQTEMMYRAFGKDAVLDSYAQRAVTHASLNTLYCFQNFNGKYTLKNVTPEEIKVFKETQKANMSTKTSMLDEVLELKGKIQPGTPEYAEAKKYLEASINYKSPSMLNGVKVLPAFADEIMTAYKNNLLEANAFREGEKISDMYSKFQAIIKK